MTIHGATYFHWSHHVEPTQPESHDYDEADLDADIGSSLIVIAAFIFIILTMSLGLSALLWIGISNFISISSGAFIAAIVSATATCIGVIAWRYLSIVISK